MTTTKELLPCPFCGGVAEVETYGATDVSNAVCTECGAVGRGEYGETEAAEAWNARAGRTCSVDSACNRVEELEQLLYDSEYVSLRRLELIITLEDLCRDLWDDTVQIHELEGYSTSEELEQRMESLGLLGGGLMESKNQTNGITLLPCPFCGGEASVKVLEYDDDCKVWGVFCESDLESEYSHGHFVDNYRTEAEAIAAWNTRAERTCHVVGTICSDGWTIAEDPLYYHELSCGHEVETLGKEPPSYCSECGARVVEG